MNANCINTFVNANARRAYYQSLIWNNWHVGPCKSLVKISPQITTNKIALWHQWMGIPFEYQEIKEKKGNKYLRYIWEDASKASGFDIPYISYFNWIFPPYKHFDNYILSEIIVTDFDYPSSKVCVLMISCHLGKHSINCNCYSRMSIRYIPKRTLFGLKLFYIRKIEELCFNTCRGTVASLWHRCKKAICVADCHDNVTTLHRNPIGI